MRTIFIFFLMITGISHAQNILRGRVVDDHSGEPIPGVNVIAEGTLTGTATGMNGEFILGNLTDGNHTIIFSHIGYQKAERIITFPAEEYLIIKLEEESSELDEIFVNATRSSRTIENEPVRVEVIAGEEIDEKISMDPSNISMMLNESTGIQVQQTSAASANNSFRIQGLEGRYTQLLKDGFPLYSGFSGSLSIVQIPPLDLQQIEIIKGSSSVLYGEGAIAGLINLISKHPEELREISMLVNGTSALGLDISGYYSEMFEDFGVTLLASRNVQKEYDNNDDLFTDIPKISRYSVSPKIFLYLNENSTVETSFDMITEERIGGSLSVLKGERNPFPIYTEENLSSRFSGRVRYNQKIGDNSLNIKYSMSYFKRDLNLPGYSFRGKQISSYAEAAYSIIQQKNSWVAGVNMISQNFNHLDKETIDLSYDDLILGGFLQSSSDISEQLSLDAGARGDYNKEYGFFFLPGASLLVKFNKDWSGRLGGGLGYKIPSIFTESAEQLAFVNVLPLDKNSVKAEKSWGGNFDINYRTILFGDLTFSINQLFFYTRINDPMILQGVRLTAPPAQEYYEYQTLPGYNISRGTESNIKLTYGDFRLFAGYSFTEVRTFLNGNSTEFPLSPKNRLGLILLYEEHDNIRIGLEAYYTGRQKLTGIGYTEPYWINGLMIEKRLGGISLFLNFENFLDVKQSNYGQMFTGSPDNPVFSEVYAPTDGRIINGGIKIKF